MYSYFYIFLFISYANAIMPSICIDPQPIGMKKITKYLYENGVCNKMVFLSLAPPYTYFDEEEECIRRCVNSTRD